MSSYFTQNRRMSQFKNVNVFYIGLWLKYVWDLQIVDSVLIYTASWLWFAVFVIHRAHVNMRACTLYSEGWAHSHICTATTWLQSKGTLKHSFLKAVCASCSFPPISSPSLPLTLLPPPPSIHLCLPNSITVNHVSHPDTFLFHQAVGQYSLTLP